MHQLSGIQDDILEEYRSNGPSNTNKSKHMNEVVSDNDFEDDDEEEAESPGRVKSNKFDIDAIKGDENSEASV